MARAARPRARRARCRRTPASPGPAWPSAACSALHGSDVERFGQRLEEKKEVGPGVGIVAAGVAAVEHGEHVSDETGVLAGLQRVEQARGTSLGLGQPLDVGLVRLLDAGFGEWR